MSIRARLFGGFAGILVLLLALVVLSGFTAEGINANLTEVRTKYAVAQRAGIDFRGSAHDRSIAIRDVVLATDPADRQREVQEIERLAQFYAAAAQRLDQLLRTHPEMANEVRPYLTDIQTIEAKAVALTQRVQALKLAGQDAEAEALLWQEVKRSSPRMCSGWRRSTA